MSAPNQADLDRTAKIREEQQAFDEAKRKADIAKTAGASQQSPTPLEDQTPVPVAQDPIPVVQAQPVTPAVTRTVPVTQTKKKPVQVDTSAVVSPVSNALPDSSPIQPVINATPTLTPASSPSPTVTPLTTIVTSPYGGLTQTSSENSSSNKPMASGAIAGIVIAIVLFFVLTGSYLYLRRYRQITDKREKEMSIAHSSAAFTEKTMSYYIFDNSHSQIPSLAPAATPELSQSVYIHSDSNSPVSMGPNSNHDTVYASTVIMQPYE